MWTSWGSPRENRAFDKDAPLYGILEGCTQQPINLVDRRAGKEPLLLLFGQFLLLALDIRTAGRFAQSRVEVFHVIGLEFLHLHAADIGDNKVLEGEGVFKITSEGNITDHLFSGKTVSSIYKDYSGNLWFGGYYSGLYMQDAKGNVRFMLPEVSRQGL